MGESDAPDYDKVRLHTPVSFYNVSDASTDAIEPDRNASVRAPRRGAAGRGRHRPMRYPWATVGQRRLSQRLPQHGQRRAHQGWGHPGNLAVRCANLTAAPYLRYKVNGTTVTLNDEAPGTAYVDKSKWGDALRDQDAARSVLPKAEKREAASLRGQLRGGEDAPFRAAQAWNQMPTTSNASAPSAKCRAPSWRRRARRRATRPGAALGAQPEARRGARADPFVRFGECFDASGPRVTFPARILSLSAWTTSCPRRSSSLIGADATAGNAATISLTAALTSNTSAANPELAKVKQVFKDVYGGAWPYHLLTMVRAFEELRQKTLNTPFET